MPSEVYKYEDFSQEGYYEKDNKWTNGYKE